MKPTNIISVAEYRLLLKKAKQKKAIKSKGKDAIGLFLIESGLVFESEFKFHSTRKWRFDWALPGHMIAIEYEGIFSEKSRHTSIVGYSNDIEKYNSAIALGWRVLRYTAKNYKNIISDLEKLLNLKYG